jgi:hypothetical protein
MTDERGFPAAGWADEHEQFAAFHVQIDAAQGGDLRSADAVGLGDAAAADGDLFGAKMFGFERHVIA